MCEMLAVLSIAMIVFGAIGVAYAFDLEMERVRKDRIRELEAEYKTLRNQLRRW